MIHRLAPLSCIAVLMASDMCMQEGVAHATRVVLRRSAMIGRPARQDGRYGPEAGTAEGTWAKHR